MIKKTIRPRANGKVVRFFSHLPPGMRGRSSNKAYDIPLAKLESLLTNPEAHKYLADVLEDLNEDWAWDFGYLFSNGVGTTVENLKKVLDAIKKGKTLIEFWEEGVVGITMADHETLKSKVREAIGAIEMGDLDVVYDVSKLCKTKSKKKTKK